MLISVLVHATVIGVLLARAPSWASDAEGAHSTWMEAVEQPPPVLPVAPPAPAAPPPAHVRPARVAKARPVRVAPAVRDGRATGIPDGQGTLAMGAEGNSTVATSAEEPADSPASEDVATSAPAQPTPAETERTPRPAQLSLWIDRKAFEHSVLLRPGIAIVSSVPGLRDLLRGSDIRPFYDLDRLRITLTELTPQSLVLAGVHTKGEQGVREAAKRIAAMRRREPVWRGDSKLQATSWMDGSGLDRGLAMHDAAFLIGARESLPGLLGDAVSDDQVDSLSRLRKRVVFALAIEEVSRYVPVLSACALQALRVSIASTAADTQRMSLRAEYETSTAARESPECFAGLGDRAAPLSALVAWLARAPSTPGSFTTHFNSGITNDEIQALLDELAWVLRSAGRG
jgi:hypothetical protein